MQDIVLLERHASVALLRLNLPEKLNPLTLPLMQRLRERLAALRADRSVRALVITGAGRSFCVGADLSSILPQDGQGAGTAMVDAIGREPALLVQNMRTLPFPVVAALNGPCVGAGVGLALAADVVVAARSSYFYLPFMPRLGAIPDFGTTWFLERFVGRARAVALTLLDERLPAARAYDWGLVWEVVDDEALQEQSLAIADRLARLPAHAAEEVRAIYEQAARQGLAEQIDSEFERQRELLNRPTFREGVVAFLTKRAPVFVGR